MTQDEIIEMARQAGLDDIDERGIYIYENFDIEAFAKLVAAKAFQDGYSIGEAAGFKQAIKLERARGEA